MASRILPTTVPGVTSATGTQSTAAQNGTTTTKTDTQGVASNFQQFLTLLTTQLKNQNPLDPMDTNQFTQQLVQFAQVDPEKVDHFELGAKTQFWDRRITFNLTGFWTQIRDYQALVNDGQNSTLRGYLANAGKVRVRWYKVTNDAPNAAWVGALAVLGITAALVPQLGTEFLPELNEGSIWINITLPTSVSVDEAKDHLATASVFGRPPEWMCAESDTMYEPFFSSTAAFGSK